MKLIILLCASIFISGCATKYQPMGFTGGVAAQQITADTFRISARGNGYTASTTVQDHMMLKAAETTKEAGATHFAIVGAEDASRSDTISTPGHARTSVVGNTAYTTYSPGYVQNVFKPGRDAYIKLLSIDPGNAPPAGAISADEIIQFVGVRVKRG